MRGLLFKLVLLGLTAVSVGAPPGAADELIDDHPLNSDETLKEVPLVGYRQFPKEALILVDPIKNKWVLNYRAYYQAATKDPLFLQFSQKSRNEVQTMPLTEFGTLYQKAASNTRNLNSDCTKTSENCAARVGEIVQLNTDALLGRQAIDPQFVHLAVARGLFNPSQIVPVRDPNDPNAVSFGVPINSAFALATKHLYGTLDVNGPKEKLDSVFAIADAIRMSSYNEELEKITKIKFANIKIGVPFVFSANEKHLALEGSISKRFDVYWITFAINPQIDLRGKIDEISFFISLKTTDALALDLAPIRFGQETTKKEEIGTPEIKVETPRGGVSVGRFYGQEIAYKTLKPTIVGTGILANEFGWSMSDDMVDMSAKRFVAIVGVPKGSRKLSLEMVLRARPSPQYGIFQQNVLNSEPINFTADLPR